MWLSDGGGEDAADDGSDRVSARLTLAGTFGRARRGIGSLDCAGPLRILGII